MKCNLYFVHFVCHIYPFHLSHISPLGDTYMSFSFDTYFLCLCSIFPLPLSHISSALQPSPLPGLHLFRIIFLEINCFVFPQKKQQQKQELDLTRRKGYFPLFLPDREAPCWNFVQSLSFWTISINFLGFLINELTHFDTKLMVTVVDKIGCLVFRVPFSWPMDD